MTQLDDYYQSISEKDFWKSIKPSAKKYGWMIVHFRTVQDINGSHYTPVDGDTGSPDVLLAHPKHGVYIVELKKEKGRLTENQKKWAAAAEPHNNWALWKPSMIKQIDRFLEKGGAIPQY